MKVHIVGAGIIGLCTAWYLRKEGAEVTVIDCTDLSDGTSHGNSGMIVPSHFIPLASPGVVTKAIRWMFDPKSPFAIRPTINLDFFCWLWTFYRSCTDEKVERASFILKEFNEYSKRLYEEFSQIDHFDFRLEKKGILMIYKTAQAEKEEIEIAKKAEDLGLIVKKLISEELQQLENTIEINARGAIYYPGDAHFYPNLFMSQLAKELENLGVVFFKNRKVKDFVYRSKRISGLIFTDGEQADIDNLVLANGIWACELAHKLGQRLLLQSGKGYSLTMTNPAVRPSVPAILVEARVAVTPMGNDLRIGGTMEIGNMSGSINQNRLHGILESLPKYYPDLNIHISDPGEVWCGFRPCTPDGLPYIGRSSRYTNLIFATGHAMMGMSLGPATGKLVSEILCQKDPGLDLSLFHPDRF